MSNLDVEQVVAELRKRRFRFTCEKDLQDGLEEVFVALGIEYERESRLSPKDKVDFLLLGEVGLEVKIQDSLTSVTRQLHRYSQHDKLKSLILVTCRAAHRGVPEQMNNKVLELVYLPPF